MLTQYFSKQRSVADVGHVVRHCCLRPKNVIQQQEASEKCWAHSLLRAASRPLPGVASGTVARRLRIDVHDIDNA